MFSEFEIFSPGIFKVRSRCPEELHREVCPLKIIFLFSELFFRNLAKNIWTFAEKFAQVCQSCNLRVQTQFLRIIGLFFWKKTSIIIIFWDSERKLFEYLLSFFCRFVKISICILDTTFSRGDVFLKTVSLLIFGCWRHFSVGFWALQILESSGIFWAKKFFRKLFLKKLSDFGQKISCVWEKNCGHDCQSCFLLLQWINLKKKTCSFCKFYIIWSSSTSGEMFPDNWRIILARLSKLVFYVQI